MATTDWQLSALLWRPHKEGQLDVPFRRKKWQEGCFDVMVGGPRFNLFSLPKEQVAAVFGVMAVCTNLIFHIRVHQWEQPKTWLKWLENQAKERIKDYETAHDNHAFGRRLFLSEQAIVYGADVRNTFGRHDAGMQWELPNVRYFSRLVRPRPVVSSLATRGDRRHEPR